MSNIETTVTHIGAWHDLPATTTPGDNSEKFGVSPTNSSANGSANATPNKANEQLRSVVARIEQVEEEKKALSDDIRNIYAEAKGGGYDIKALRTIIRLRKMSVADRQEQETILETYMQAMGML